jgi:hypothetical protein
MESSRASKGEHVEAEAAPEPRVGAGAAGQAAQVLGLQRSIGNRRTAALLAGAPTRRLQRYKILGPFNVGQAVHETLTLLAVKQAKERIEAAGVDPGELLSSFDSGEVPREDQAFGYDPIDAHTSHQQFIRGVVWADDPEGLLFDDAEGTTDYSFGAMWKSDFDAGKGGDVSSMTARSHFGDLQFFHAMATADGEAPMTTKQNMLGWARFLVSVATGRTATNKKLGKIPEVSGHFKDMAKRTVKELFGFAKGSDVQIRQRAVGALFHMIQDSYAHGHVERDEAGDIREFHAYGAQDEHKHGEHDFLGGSWYNDLGPRLDKTKGARSAIDACADVLEMIDARSDTDLIVGYLGDVVFRVSAGATPSGPGTGLAKPPPPPPRPRWMDPLYMPLKF